MRFGSVEWWNAMWISYAHNFNKELLLFPDFTLAFVLSASIVKIHFDSLSLPTEIN